MTRRDRLTVPEFFQDLLGVSESFLSMSCGLCVSYKRSEMNGSIERTECTARLMLSARLGGTNCSILPVGLKILYGISKVITYQLVARQRWDGTHAVPQVSVRDKHVREE